MTYNASHYIRTDRLSSSECLEEFPQVGGEFDEVGCYDALGDEVDHGQHQERFMRSAEFGCCRPAGAAGVGAEGGEGFCVVGDHCGRSVCPMTEANLLRL